MVSEKGFFSQAAYQVDKYADSVTSGEAFLKYNNSVPDYEETISPRSSKK